MCGKECYSTEAPPTECQDGIYPHETECNKFYQCSDGIRYPDQEF